MSRDDEEDLLYILKNLRDLRAWAYHTKVDPWVFRQGLIMVLEMDTDAALKRGVSEKDLQLFDKGAKSEARRWISKFEEGLT